MSAGNGEDAMEIGQTRRRFLTALSLAGAANLLSLPRALAAEDALETTTVRLPNDHSICIAPEYMAEELLRAEGFTDIRYVEAPGSRQYDAFLSGELDFTNFVPAGGIQLIEAGSPIVVLAGIHIGCFELFATEGVRHIGDLKGKSIGLRVTPVGVLTLMAAQVGLDPAKDIRWVTAAESGADPLAGEQPRLRPQVSGRDQARAARCSEGRRSLRRRAGARRPPHRRWPVHRPV